MIPRLFYITDGERGTAGRPLHEVVARAFEGGVEAVVVRERSLETGALARLIDSLDASRSQGLRVLVSRRLDLARALGLDGVHLAADAVDVATARGWLGPDAWLGYSAHSGEEARDVAARGADYVTLSPIRATSSKPGACGRGIDWLRKSLSGLEIPALALGGVAACDIEEILRAGAWGVAAVSAIGAAPDVAAAASAFREALWENRS
ncbi:MAG: thiamine phosphate synthase [Deltaproteobacteria bacterium]|nr:thiamine phosphate synthase [Deltaproteobacteria bacterium]MBW2415124.1 thiamine phosphate synthase [Deltaproteobacteria bacterium]